MSRWAIHPPLRTPACWMPSSPCEHSSMRLKLLLAFLLSLIVFSLAAADLNGRWSGAIHVAEGADKVDLPILVILKHSGSSLSGTAGADEANQRKITKSSVNDDKIMIEFVDGDSTYHLELTVDGDEMSGEANSGDSPKMKVTLKRG